MWMAAFQEKILCVCISCTLSCIFVLWGTFALIYFQGRFIWRVWAPFILEWNWICLASTTKPLNPNMTFKCGFMPELHETLACSKTYVYFWVILPNVPNAFKKFLYYNACIISEKRLQMFSSKFVNLIRAFLPYISEAFYGPLPNWKYG